MTRIEFLPNRIRQMINFGNLANELRNSYDEFLRQTWAKLPESPSFKAAELKDFRNIEVSPLSLTTFLGVYKAFGILNGGLTHSSFINRYSLLLHVPIFHKLSLVGDYAPEWKFKNVQALAQVVRLEATQAIQGMGEEMGQAIIDNLPPHKAYANKQRLVHRMMPLAQKISDIFSPFAQSAFLTLLLVGIDEGRMGASFFANEAEALLEAKKLPTPSKNMDRLRWILNQHINRFLACFEAQRLPESQTADKVVFDATICLKDDLLSRSVARDLPRYRAFLQMARPAFEQANQALLSGDLNEGVVFPIKVKRSETQAGPLHLYYDVSILLTALGVVQKPRRRENMQVTAQSFRFDDVICRKWAALASGVPEAVAYQAASIFTAFGRLVKDSPEAAFNVVAGLPLEGVIQPQKGEEAIAILEPAYRRIAASFAPIIEDAVGAALGEVHGTYSTERNESAMHAAVRVASNLLKAQKDLRAVDDQAVANRIFGEVFMDNSCLLAESIRSAFTRPGGEWIYPEQEKDEASQAEETRAEDGERYEGAVPTQGEWTPSVESQAEDGAIQQGDMAPKKTSSRSKKAADKTARQGYQR